MTRDGMGRGSSRQPTVDLHGLTGDAALDHLVARCNAVYNGGYRGWITVVHGYGSTGIGGVTKQRVRKLFAHNSNAYECRFNDAVNPGSTDVKVLQPLPEKKRTSSPLEGQILAFCASPKEESRIGNRFHRLTAAELKAVIKGLQTRGRLAVVKTNGRKAWQAVTNT